MAFNCGARFPPNPTPYTLLDPGSYQYSLGKRFDQNKCPFNSCSQRHTSNYKKAYTDAIYDSRQLNKVPGCQAAFKSKVPRFKHEAFKIEEFEQFLCDCNEIKECECIPDNNEIHHQEKEIVVCQGKIPRRIIIGKTPKYRDDDEEVEKREKFVWDPPFYDARVYESTMQYHGWKWSQWTSKRQSANIEQRPGPADYNLEKKPTAEQLCMEQLRFYKRKTSRQLRFLEMVQQRNIRENMPSPADYYPQLPKPILTLPPENKPVCTKCPCDTSDTPESEYKKQPGPADYMVPRLFDMPPPPCKRSGFKAPAPAFFGMKDTRFKERKQEGPGPSDYSVDYRGPRFLVCTKAPFGTSALRWKNEPIPDYDSSDDERDTESNYEKDCVNPQWMFKSRSFRFKPLIKEPKAPILEDINENKNKRCQYMQFLAPFNSSEGKFQPFYNNMSYYGITKTPHVCYYNPKKAKCSPVYVRGPLMRSPRFKMIKSATPAPNEYKIPDTGTSTHTFNKNIRRNLDNRYQFKWTPPNFSGKVVKSPDQKFTELLQKSILLCETVDVQNLEPVKERICDPKCERICKPKDPKLLKCFLYSKQIPANIT